VLRDKKFLILDFSAIVACEKLMFSKLFVVRVHVCLNTLVTEI